MNRAVEVSLPEIVSLVRKNIVLILGLGVGAAIIGLLLVLVLPKSYRASIDILVLRPAYKESEANFSELVPETLTVPTCENLLNSAGLLNKVFTKSGLRDEGEITIETFMKNLRTRTRIEKETNYDIIRSPVITLYATADTPDMAEKVVELWADEFLSGVKDIREGETSDVHSFIGEQFDDVDADLKAAEDELREYEARFNIDLITEEKDKKEGSLTDFQVKSAEVTVQLEAVRDKLAKLEADKTPNKVSLAKAITDTAFWLSWLEQNPDAQFPEKLRNKWLITEEMNPTRLAVEQEIVGAWGLEKSLEGELRMTNEKIEELDRDVAILQARYAEVTMDLTRLKRAVSDHETTRELLVTERDKAEIAKGSGKTDVRQWADAVLPEKPIFPRRKGFVIALAFAPRCAAGLGIVLYRYLLKTALTEQAA